MKPNDSYVSDFEKFMGRFLEAHPEVEEDQRRGRLIYWDHKVDLAALEKAEEDSVPEDGYGFYYLSWLRKADVPVSGAHGSSS